ncbi:probable carboxylesterase 12 [Pistacia vera]|uniref:probable carboxylesterase 12 n=1 Tax=Pistacia vera TaxID=55513 RepID=UPI0012633BBA|nr:probable carboxylesterase 12 [Pistacia vera]
MEYATKPEVAYDFSPVIIMYKDGRVEKLQGSEIVPPSLDPKTNVESKDVLYSPENGLSVRLHIPKNTNRNQKLPLLVYFHGGGFYIRSPFTPQTHNLLNSLVAEANIIAVSVEYRKAPEHPVPCAFDDSWTALQWVKSHVNGAGPEDWLNDYADFQRVFFCGDSAGATIAHHMGIRHGQEKLEGVNVKGIALCHPYFWGKEPVGDESTDAEFRQRREKYWRVACPSSSGCDDRWINPAADPNLARLGCRRVLIFVAEKDFLRTRGWYYYEKLKESGWGGNAEITETEGEGHVFHVKNPTCKNAVAMLKRIACFFNQE